MESYKKISLTQGFETIVDEKDFISLNRHKWFAKKGSFCYYAARSFHENGTCHTILMHRFLLDCPKGKEVDHLNGDSLDNRRENLDIVCRAENLKRMNFNKKK